MIARLEAMLEALRIVRPVLVVSWIAPSAES
jgi:cell division inhibitor SulA